MYHELYERLRAGDELAAREFHHVFRGRLRDRLRRRFAGRLAPWQIEDAAFDALQDVLLKCAKFPSWQAAECYAFRAGMTRCLTRLRKPAATCFSELELERDRRFIVLGGNLGQIETRWCVEAEVVEHLGQRDTTDEGRVVTAIAQLLLWEGRDASERAIARRAGVSRRRVRRVLLRLASRESSAG